MGNFLTKCNNNLNSFNELFIYVEDVVHPKQAALGQFFDFPNTQQKSNTNASIIQFLSLKMNNF